MQKYTAREIRHAKYMREGLLAFNYDADAAELYTLYVIYGLSHSASLLRSPFFTETDITKFNILFRDDGGLQSMLDKNKYVEETIILKTPNINSTFIAAAINLDVYETILLENSAHW